MYHCYGATQARVCPELFHVTFSDVIHDTIATLRRLWDKSICIFNERLDILVRTEWGENPFARSFPSNEGFFSRATWCEYVHYLIPNRPVPLLITARNRRIPEYRACIPVVVHLTVLQTHSQSLALSTPGLKPCRQRILEPLMRCSDGWIDPQPPR